MHTEAEARNKWCPEARIAEVRLAQQQGYTDATRHVAATVNRPDCNCIGRACMHWRWQFEDYYDGAREGALSDKAKGFCGLSGRP